MRGKVLIMIKNLVHYKCSKTVQSVWKSPKKSHSIFSILAFSINFCSIKSDLSGNTVWPQTSVFQTLAKIDHFWHFWWPFDQSKCKAEQNLNILVTLLVTWMNLLIFSSFSLNQWFRSVARIFVLKVQGK